MSWAQVANINATMTFDAFGLLNHQPLQIAASKPISWQSPCTHNQRSPCTGIQSANMPLLLAEPLLSGSSSDQLDAWDAIQVKGFPAGITQHSEKSLGISGATLSSEDRAQKQVKNTLKPTPDVQNMPTPAYIPGADTCKWQQFDMYDLNPQCSCGTWMWTQLLPRWLLLFGVAPPRQCAP
eukprot:1128102-Pelagomonas_calceolata.AAC.1